MLVAVSLMTQNPHCPVAVSDARDVLTNTVSEDVMDMEEPSGEMDQRLCPECTVQNKDLISRTVRISTRSQNGQDGKHPDKSASSGLWAINSSAVHTFNRPELADRIDTASHSSSSGTHSWMSSP